MRRFRKLSPSHIRRNDFANLAVLILGEFAAHARIVSSPTFAHMLNEDCLNRIFVHAVPSPVIAAASPLDPRIISPINFSAVCRSWRQAASDNPSLWSSILIEHPDESDTTSLHTSFLRFVELWIKNSRDVPLTVKFRLRGVAEYFIYSKILDLVFSESHRWKDILLHIGVRGLAGSPVTTRCPITVRCPPSLKSLYLDLDYYCGYIPYYVIDLSDYTAANEIVAPLRCGLSYQNIKWGLPEKHGTLRLPNLLVLNMNANIGTELLAILSASPNLWVLRLIDGLLASPEPVRFEKQAETQEVLLMDLFKLEIVPAHDTDSEREFKAKIVDFLACPSLRYFTFRGRLITFQQLRSFTSFFSRQLPASGSRLVALRLFYLHSVDHIPPASHHEHFRALLEMLRLLNSLEVLQLEGFLINNVVLGELTVSRVPGTAGRSEVLCPSLSYLLIAAWENVGVSKEAAEEMVVSRWESGCRLREMSLKMPGFEHFGSYSDRMKALVKEGLVVYDPYRENITRPL